MPLLLVFIILLFLIFVIALWGMASDSDESDRPVAFKVKLEVLEDKCDDRSPTGNMSPRHVRGHVRGGVRRRKAGAGEVSHYAKMHSRTRYRI